MIYGLIAGLSLALGAMIGFVVAASRSRKIDKERIQLAEQVRMLIPTQSQLETLSDEKNDLEKELTKLETEREAEKEKIDWVTKAQEQLRDAFKALSSEVLRSNSDQYIKQVKEQLDSMQKLMKGDWGKQKEEMSGLVSPLKENLGKLDQQVQQMEKKREGAYEGLKQNLDQLQNAYTSLRDTTTSLSTALTKSSGARGSWGEIKLRRIVELAGMVNRVDFDEQQQQGEGRPDMKVYLPNGGVLPVDAKTVFKTYEDIVNAEDETERKAKQDAHCANVRGRINDLGNKTYWEQFEKSPEFVIMFLPHDGFLSAAFDGDSKGDLLEYAFGKKVLLVTPVTLLALLKTVAYGWQQQDVAANAREIADQGRELYDRILVFMSHMTGTGKSLDSAVASYNKAVGSMEARVLPSIRRFKELGVSTKEAETPSQVDRQARLPETQSSESIKASQEVPPLA